MISSRQGWCSLAGVVFKATKSIGTRHRVLLAEGMLARRAWWFMFKRQCSRRVFRSWQRYMQVVGRWSRWKSVQGCLRTFEARLLPPPGYFEILLLSHAWVFLQFVVACGGTPCQMRILATVLLKSVPRKDLNALSTRSGFFEDRVGAILLDLSSTCRPRRLCC